METKFINEEESENNRWENKLIEIMGEKFIKKAAIPGIYYEDLYKIVFTLKNADFEFQYVWQLQLLTGEPTYFQEHINKVDEYGMTSAHYAALSGKEKALTCVKELNATLLETKSDAGGGIELTGMFSKSPEIIHWLYRENPAYLQGASKNQSPLIYAATIGWLEGIIILNDYFPDLDMEEGAKFLHEIVSCQQIPILEWLKINKPEFLFQTNHSPIFHHAVTKNLFAVAEWVIKTPQLAASLDELDATIIHSAARSGNKELLDLSIKHKGDFLHKLDERGANFAVYALNSYDVSFFNYALSLSENSFNLHNICLRSCIESFSPLLEKLQEVLEENISLQSISFSKRDNTDLERKLAKSERSVHIYNEIHSKLERNNKILEGLNNFYIIMIPVVLSLKDEKSSFFIGSLIPEILFEICSKLLLLHMPEPKLYHFTPTFFSQASKVINQADSNSESRNLECGIVG